MAARKSCTKLTWAEAKDRCGVGGSKNPHKAGSKISQQPNHGKLLAAKIIAKSGPDESQSIKNRQAARMARRDELRQKELDKQRELEKERKRLDDVVKPHEKAMERLAELEEMHHQKIAADRGIEGNDHGGEMDPDRGNLVCESKQLQVDEVLALEAIYADTETLRVSEASGLEDLQEKIDAWQDDPDQIDLRAALVNHPAVSYTLRRSIEDPADEDRVAHLLLHVEYQEDYPLESTPPATKLLWCLVTRKSLVVSSNKPLESLGILDEAGLFRAMGEEAEESLLGMPSVYELLDTWLNEHFFDYVQACPTRDKN